MMTKKNLLNISKSSGLAKKPYLTLNEITKKLVDSGYNNEEIDALTEKINNSQFIFGNFDDKKLIDLNKDLRIITSAFVKEKAPQYKEIPQIEKKLLAFTPLVKDIKQHIKDKQTTTELIRNAMEVDLNFSNNPVKINNSVSRLIENYNKFKNTPNYIYFDTEILGGTNKYGMNEMLMFQEFALTYVKKSQNGADVTESKSLLFGLDKDNVEDKKVIERLENYINSFRDTKELDTESVAGVSLRRLAKLGNKNTEIEYKNGIASIKKWANDTEIEDDLNISDIEEGLKKVLEIGAYNKSVTTNATELNANEQLPVSQVEFFRMLHDLNENFVLGKNNIAADTPWINRKAYEYAKNLTPNQEYYLKKLYGDEFSTLYYVNGMIDQESVNRTATALMGNDRYTTNAQQAIASKLGLSLGKLEAIGQMYYPEVYKQGGAHTAAIDNLIGIKYASMPLKQFNSKSLMEQQMEDIIDNFKSPNGTILGNKIELNGKKYDPIFIAKNSDMYFSNPLDMTYYPMNDELHFGLKATLDENGNIGRTIFKPGNKKNVSYTTQVYQFNPTDKMFDEMEKINDLKYNRNVPYYMVQYTPIYNKEQDNKELYPIRFKLFSSRDEAEADISNNYMLYAVRDENGNIRFINEQDGFTKEQVDNVMNELKFVSINKNGIEYQDATVEDVLDYGLEYMQNDSAARSIRNYDLKKATDFTNVNNYLESKEITDPKDKRDILAQITSNNIAEEISKGHDLTLDIQEMKSDITELIGYQGKNGRISLSPNTYKNFLATYNYYDSYGDTLKDIVDLSYKSNNPKLAYATYMRNIEANINDKIQSDKELLKQFNEYKNNLIGKDKRLAYEMNYFEIPIAKNYFHNYNNPDTPDVLKIDLSPRGYYKLKNQLLNAEYGASSVKNMNPIEKEEYSKKELVRFANYVNNLEGTKNVFWDSKQSPKPLTVEDINVSLDVFSEKLVNKLRDLREENPTVGYITADNFENVLEGNLGIDFLKNIGRDDIIKNSINKTTEFLSHVSAENVTNTKESTINRLSKELVDNYLFKKGVDPEGKYKTLNELATFASKTYGFDKGIFYTLAAKTYDDEMSIAKSITKSVIANGGDFIFNDDKVVVSFGGNAQVDITKYLPMARFKDGRFDVKLGDTNIMTGLSLNVKDSVDYATGELNSNDIKISSGLIKASRRLRGLNKSIKSSIERGDNPADMLAYTLKKSAEEIRSNPQSSTASNVADMINAYSNINLEEIIPLLGLKRDELLASGKLNDMGAKALENNNAESLKKGIATSELIQVIPSNFEGIMKYVLDTDEFDTNKLDEYILSMVNASNKDTALAKYIFRIGGKDISPLQRYDNDKRPVRNQAWNSKVYNKRSLDKYISENVKEDDAFKYISSISRLVSPIESKMNEKTIEGIGKTTSAINALVANIDDETYHKMLSKYYNSIKDKISDEDKEKYEKSFQYLSNLNLYNGEKIVNSRLAYKMFEDAETQYIRAEKNIIDTMINAKIGDEINQEMFKKRIMVIPIIKLNKDGTVTFEYNAGQMVKIGDVITETQGYGDVISRETSNLNGLLTMKVYAKGTHMEISDSDIQKELNRLIIDSPQDAIEYIKQKYDFNYAITPGASKGYNKLYIDQEKGMGASTALGAGFYDRSIKKVLEETGNESFVNKILNEDYAKILYKENEDIFKKYGFASSNSFIKALREERNFAQDNILSNINGLKNIAIITNDDLAHHENTGMFLRNMINTAATKKADELMEKDKNLSVDKAYEKAYKEVADILNFPNVIGGYDFSYDDKSRRILINPIQNEDAFLELDQIVKLGNKLGLDENTAGKVIRDENGNPLFSINNAIIYSAGNTEFAGTSRSYEKEIKAINKKIEGLKSLRSSKDKYGNPVIDYDTIEYYKNRKRDFLDKNRLMNIDARSMLSLQSPRYSTPEENADLRDIWTALDEGKTYNKLFSEIFDNDKNGNPILKEGESEYVNNQLIKEFNNKVLLNKDLEYMGGKQLKLDEDYILGEEADSVKQRIYNRFIGKDISIEKAELNYALEQSNLAMKYNSEKKKEFTDNALLDSGFKSVNILDDIFIPKGHGSASMIDNKNALIEKNILLTVNDKKIAVPYMPSSIVGDQLINTERISLLRSMNNTARTIEDARQGKTQLEKPVTYYEDILSDQIQKLKDTLKIENNELAKETTKVKLSNYNFSKLAGIEYHKNDSGVKYLNNSMYEKSKFAGKSLGELAEKDIYISAGTVGEDYFIHHTNLLEKETLSKYGMTRDEMLNYLEESGTMAMFSRNPNTEARSTSPIMLYLDRTSKTDKIRVIAELTEATNGDFDGDVGALALAMLNEQSYAEAKLLSRKNGTPLDKDWRDMERSIAQSASGNLRARKEIVEPRMQKENKNMLQTVYDIFGKNADSTQKKYIFGSFGKNVTEKEIKDNTYISKLLSDKVIEEIGEEKFKTLNDDQVYEALLGMSDKIFGEGNRGRIKRTLNFVNSVTRERITELSKTAKNDVGYMDTPMVQLQQLSEVLNGKDSVSNHLIQAVSKTLRESPISRKKNTKLETTVTADIRKAWKGATENFSAESVNEFVKLMEPFKEDIVTELKSKTTIASSLIDNKNNDEIFEMATDKVKGILTELGKNKNLQYAFNDIKKSNYSNINNKKYKSTALPFSERLADLMGEVKISPEEIQSSRIDLSGFKKESAKKVLQTGESIIENTKHGMSGLGLSALGLAAAVMLTGYVGGNPSKPAQNHAQDQSNSEYDSLQDEDLQINRLPEGSKQGYVININATSDKGRKHVQDAIQVAMQSSVPTDINIQMNIDDKTRNIDNRYITKLLSGAI